MFVIDVQTNVHRQELEPLALKEGQEQTARPVGSRGDTLITLVQACTLKGIRNCLVPYRVALCGLHWLVICLLLKGLGMPRRGMECVRGGEYFRQEALNRLLQIRK